MRETFVPIHEKRVRTIEEVAVHLVPSMKLSHIRPHPPVGVTLVGDLLRWERPHETRNVTHYLIYSPDERYLVHRAPLGQLSWENAILEDTVLVSCWNDLTKRESRKIVAIPAE